MNEHLEILRTSIMETLSDFFIITGAICSTIWFIFHSPMHLFFLSIMFIIIGCMLKINEKYIQMCNEMIEKTKSRKKHGR